MVYHGDFSANKIDGKGEIKHTDTGNVFSGTFRNGYKQGPAEFKLAAPEGRESDVLKTKFEFNVEVPDDE